MGRLREAYSEALQDPSLLDLRPEIAILQVRQDELLKRAMDNDSPAFRGEIRRMFSILLKAYNDEDEEGFEDIAEKLRVTIEEGVTDDADWEKVITHVEKRSRRTEKALDLKLRHEVAINGKDLVAVLTRFIDIVFQVAPRDVAVTIVDEVDRELTGNAQIQANDA